MVESVYGTPKRSAARAARISPSAQLRPVRPTGASATGIATSLPEHGGARRAPVDVDADALAQRERLQVGAVGAQRGFAVGAAVDVVEDRARDALLRELAQVLDAGHHRHGGAFYTL